MKSQERNKLRPSWSKTPVGIALIYAAVGILWILVTDELVIRTVPSELHLFLNSIKGTLFIVITALLLYYLVRRSRCSLEAYAKELEESEKRYRLIAENCTDVIWTLDLDGRVTYVSPSVFNLRGYTAEEVMQQSLEQAICPNSIGLVYAGLERNRQMALSGAPEAPVVDEVEQPRKDGSTVWTEVVTRIMRDAQGRAIGTIGISRDISERKLATERLLQTQKMEAVGRLAGGIAHDFNNLLTIIIGYAESLTFEATRKVKEVARNEKILIAAQRAKELTQQLLAFSRQQIMQPQIIDANAHIKMICKLLERLIAEDITLRLDLDHEAGQVKVDPAQLTQVIMNLVLNARDAMPNGGNLVIQTKTFDADSNQKKTTPELPAGPYVQINVSDTGNGMDATTKKRIFEPFFTTKDVGRGTGLGLSTVYGIVKQSGGYLSVSSELGQGSVFSIYFPRVEGVAASPAALEVVVSHSGNETVLLVEDSDEIRNLVAEVLQENGYKVLTAGSPNEALEIAQTKISEIALTVTDVVMPEMNGRELTDKLRAANPTMKVLFISGYAGATLMERMIPRTSVNFLQKPFTPQQLLAKVRFLLDNDPNR